jgi:S1-C subfamily serine protease
MIPTTVKTMLTRRSLACGVALFACVAPAAALAQTADDRAAARALLAKHGDAVITVMGTLKARMSRNGQDRPAPDQAVQASGTVLDGSGLTVVSLAAIDPGALIGRNPAFAAAKVNIETELTDVKLRLADGTEVPARVVLRDTDQDLLFVRPAEPRQAALASVDTASPLLSPLDLAVVVQRLQELAEWKPAASLGTVEVVIEKPRRFYLLSVATQGTGVGASVFTIKGEFAGIIGLRASEDARHNALNGMSGTVLQTLGMVPVVIPAADIREIAKQASQAK